MHALSAVSVVNDQQPRHAEEGMSIKGDEKKERKEDERDAEQIEKAIQAQANGSRADGRC
jgi:hypothetical protein